MNLKKAKPKPNKTPQRFQFLLPSVMGSVSPEAGVLCGLRADPKPLIILSERCTGMLLTSTLRFVSSLKGGAAPTRPGLHLWPGAAQNKGATIAIQFDLYRCYECMPFSRSSGGARTASESEVASLIGKL